MTTRAFIATCETTGKRGYLARADAHAALKRMAGEGHRRSEHHRLNVYRCDACTFWHVGNIRKAS